MQTRAFIPRATEWLASHRDTPIDLIRIYLGFALFVRGWILINDPTRLEALMGTRDWFWPLLVSHYVMAAHISCGLLLAFGLTTRLAAALQLPVLAGALFGVHWREGLMAPSQSLELSALVLFLLVVITAFGAGRLSLDHYVFGSKAGPPRGSSGATDGAPEGGAVGPLDEHAPAPGPA